MGSEAKQFYEFGGFRLEAAKRVLRHGDDPVALAPKVLETLVVLVSRHGELVEKDELMKAVWPDTFVEEANLTVNISILRKTLENGEPGRSYIETVPKRGYRFVAPVRVEEAGPGQPQLPGWKAMPRYGLAAAVAGLLLLVAAAVLIVHTRERAKSAMTQGEALAAAIHTLAVLPFENLSGDAMQDYVVDGLTEALVTDLAQVHSLSVISRTSVMRYKGTHEAVPEIGRELRADGLVEGSVVLSGDRVRVTAQLIDARADKHLWAWAFEGSRAQIFDIQNQAARAIAEEVRAQLSPDERLRLSASYMPAPEAYESYLKGSYLLAQRTPPTARQAVEQFERAIKIDPRYAQAYAGLADADVVLLSFDSDPSASDLVRRGKEAAEQALRLDGSVGHAHTALAHLKLMYEWEFAGAEQEYKRGIALNPSDATAHHWYGVMLMFTGRSEEAERELRTALKFDPVSLVIPCALGRNYLLTGRLAEAAEQARQVLELDPHYADAHYLMGAVYEARKQFGEAIAEYQKYLESAGRISDTVSELAVAYAMAGKTTEARRLLAELEHHAKEMNVPPTDIAAVYAALGDRDAAIASLERGFEKKCTGMTLLLMDPEFQSLRADPRFQDILRRVGFPAAAISRFRS